MMDAKIIHVRVLAPRVQWAAQEKESTLTAGCNVTCKRMEREDGSPLQIDVDCWSPHEEVSGGQHSNHYPSKNTT